MLEANFIDSNTVNVPEGDNYFVYTELKDGHRSIFSTLDNEFLFNGNTITRKALASIPTINTIYHYSVPNDSMGSTNYTFVDPNAEYIDTNMSKSLYYSSTFVYKYCDYCHNPYYTPGSYENQFFKTFNTIYHISFIVKLYIIHF